MTESLYFLIVLSVLVNVPYNENQTRVTFVKCLLSPSALLVHSALTSLHKLSPFIFNDPILIHSYNRLQFNMAPRHSHTQRVV